MKRTFTYTAVIPHTDADPEAVDRAVRKAEKALRNLGDGDSVFSITYHEDDDCPISLHCEFGTPA